jgi:hypothetical protein
MEREEFAIVYSGREDGTRKKVVVSGRDDFVS